MRWRLGLAGPWAAPAAPAKTRDGSQGGASGQGRAGVCLGTASTGHGGGQAGDLRRGLLRAAIRRQQEAEPGQALVRPQGQRPEACVQLEAPGPGIIGETCKREKEAMEERRRHDPGPGPLSERPRRQGPACCAQLP